MYARIMSTIAGSKNTLLGYGSQLPNAAASNQIVIGTQAETTYIAGGGVVISQASLTLSGNTSLTISGNAGAAGQYMVSGGAGSAPYWGPKAPQSLTGVSWTLANPLSNLYKIQGAGSASWNLALPDPATVDGTQLWVKNMASASGAVSPSIVNQNSTSVASNVMMMQGDLASFLSDGASWYVTSASENLVTNPLYVSSVTPATGPLAGGTVLTLTGTGFAGASAVKVGGVNAPITSATATQIVATAPAGTLGSASVVVVAPLGTSLPNQLYTYLPPPTVTSITPVYGSIGGDTSVTITGTGFLGATAVSVGGAVTSFSVVNSTTITALTGAGTAGPANVSVVTPGGTGVGIGLYTYETTPTVTGINPAYGPLSGGVPVTITGTSFLGATAVSIGAAVQSFTVDSDLQITATPDVGTAGSKDVSVTTPVGTGTGTGLYTYVAPPTVAEISPSTGNMSGNMVVTITGSSFTGATAVTIGGAAVNSFTVTDENTITAVTPSGTEGSASVLVTNLVGTNDANDLYTYENVSPAKFTYTGGNQTWQIPAGVTQVTATVAGSKGINDSYNGAGATISGVVQLSTSDPLIIVCGGLPGYAGAPTAPPGGYGGGGGGYSAILTSAANCNSSGQPTYPPGNKPTGILIMAGGGGGGAGPYGKYGGNGGSWNGTNSTGGNGFGGATGGQTTNEQGDGQGGSGSGGSGGGLFTGGAGYENFRAGGGSGYYGGGGSGDTNLSAGGGSSIVNTTLVTGVTNSVNNEWVG